MSITGTVPSPLVTVVVPTHDRQRDAERAVGSVLAQTVPEVEVVVVDDASSPPFAWTGADPRVRVLRRDSPGGPAAARNDGLAAARGRWVVFLDDDDALTPDMVASALGAAASSTLPAPVAVLCAIVEVDEDGRTLRRHRPATLARGARYFLEGAGGGGSYRCDRSLLAPVEVVRSVGGFDERFPATEDKDFFLRLNAVCSLQGLDEATYRKTRHRAPSLHSNAAARARGLELTLDKHAALLAASPRHRALLLGALGMSRLVAGRWGGAVTAAARAVAVNPGRPRHYLQLGATLLGPWGFTLARTLWRTVRRAGPAAR